jgi:broad specificity phosphatase PhoE
MDDNRRRRRRRRRLIASGLFLAVALSLAWFFESQATTTVIFVRYAELADSVDGNPGISPAGQRRARDLIRALGEVDVIAGVDAIFATQYRNTQETAEPLSKHLEIPVQVVDVENVRGLEDMILREYKGKIVLVVTDRSAMWQLIRRFHGSKHVPPIADDEHDNIYILSIPWYGKVKTLRMKYGVPYAPSPGTVSDPG